ncbi:mixed lineage kinase domain-like protein isoform X2 [Osmerus eperlanus]
MDIIEPILSIAEKLYDLCKEVKANKERCQRLAARVSALAELVRVIQKSGFGPNPDIVKKGLNELKITLESAQGLVQKYVDSRFLKRIVRAYDHGEEIGSLNERLNDAAQVLSLALQVEQRDRHLDSFREETRRTQDEKDTKVDRMELEKMLQTVEDTKESVDATQKDVQDIKAMLESLKKPCVSPNIREIKPEEIRYDHPKEPFMTSACSQVFKAEYNKFTVAVKRYSNPMCNTPSQIRRIFLKEVETMRRFESPNILRMFGICVQDGPSPDYLIVMEYCERGSLRQVLDSQSNLCWYRKAHMCRGAAQGLYRLHQSEEKFKVHGCISSSKFLVASGYIVKLGGFELAKTETSLKKSKTRKSSMLCYSSPEHLESINCPYTKASEIYSFGIVLWEIATRMIPFKDASVEEIYQKVCVDKMNERLPGDCPEDLKELIDACRSYDGFFRPTAGVLADKLLKVLENLED